MWKLLLLLLLPIEALAQRGPIVWGNDNNAVYLPTNRPTVGTACLVIDTAGAMSTEPCAAGTGLGTVTSVAWGALPSWLTGTGSPITTAGSLGLVANAQAANLFLASPNGAAGSPVFRAIVAADVPVLNQNTTGSAGSLSSTFGAGLPLIGAGTGIPTVGSRSGNTTKFATVSGALVAGNVLISDASGNLIDSGSTPGSGGQAAIQYQDETVNLGTAGTSTSLNCTGAGITCSRALNAITVNVPGGGGSGMTISSHTTVGADTAVALPDAAASSGEVHVLINITIGSLFKIDVTSLGGQIHGQATDSIYGGESRGYWSNGTNWYVIF